MSGHSRNRIPDDQIEARFWAMVDRSAGPDRCWPWLGATMQKGYGTYGSRGRTRRAHRAAYEFANGPIPAGQHVCHRCDVRNCVNPAHLWLGTNADNLGDMAAKGRSATGDDHGSRKYPERMSRTGKRRTPRILSETEIAEARSVHLSGVANYRELAARYGTDESTMWRIVHNKTRVVECAA